MSTADGERKGNRGRAECRAGARRPQGPGSVLLITPSQFGIGFAYLLDPG